MKIAVYTIAKDEAENVERFMNSCQGADEVVVLDTGSKDDTIKLLKEKGARVEQKIIKPWRFDTARNEALKLVSKDIDVCISLDLDEELQEGWREKLEQAWKDDLDYMSCFFFDNGITSFKPRIHRRHGYKWVNAVHELPVPHDGREPKMALCEFAIKHYPVGESNYEPILTELIKRGDATADTYVQRAAEWITQKEWQKALTDIDKSIELSDDSPRGRRRKAFAHIDKAKCFKEMGEGDIVRELLKAVAESPETREPWIYLADAYNAIENYPMAYGAGYTGLNIVNRPIGASEDICWGEYPKKLADEAYKKLTS